MSRGEHNLIEYLDDLYSYAVLLTSDRTQAELLVQEAYIDTIEAQSRSNGNAKKYLFAHLRRAWSNWLRKNRGKLVGTYLQEVDGSCAEEQIIHLNETQPIIHLHESQRSRASANRCREVMEQLGIDLREVIFLREYEEFTYQEIAEILKCPADTIASRLARARSMLAILIQY